jgi:hypothetical protein
MLGSMVPELGFLGRPGRRYDAVGLFPEYRNVLKCFRSRSQ